MKKIFWIVCFVSTVVFSQEKASLKQAIQVISKTHDIQFSYNEKLIQNFINIDFDKDEVLKKSLMNLSIQTQLVFEQIDEETYIIRNQGNKKTSICGFVYDAKTLERIPLVNYSFEKTKYYTGSEEGYFEAKEVLFDGFVTVNALGYKSVTILVSSFKKDCQKIYLEEHIQELSEVVITDYITQGISKRKDGSIVLNPKRMGTLPGLIEPDVLQALQLIPGVQSPDETASGIHVRGSTPDQNLVVFDGMKMYHSAHFFGLLSSFNPYITNNVKLYRSGTHAKYGNNVGGVLDISVDNNIPEKISFGFGSTFTHADFYLKTPLIKEKAAVLFSARRAITDVINSITYEKFSEVAFQGSKIAVGLDAEDNRIVDADNSYFYEDYHTKVIVAPTDNSKITFSYLYNLNDLNFTGNTRNLRDEFDDKVLIENKGFHADWKFGTLEKGTHKLGFAKTSFDKSYEGLKTKTINRKGDTEVTIFDKENGVDEQMFEYIFEKKLTSNNKWQLGYQHVFNKVNYNFDRTTFSLADVIDDDINNEGNNQALFAEYQVKSKQKWLFNFGLRWQDFSDLNKSYLEPRFFVNYKASSSLRFKFSTEVKHQSISQIIDFRNDGLGGLFDRFWNLSDENRFPVLRSHQTSFGLVYQKNGWSVDAEVYQKKVEGLLYLIDEQVKGKKYFEGNNSVTGFDLLLKKEWNKYNTWVSYSLSKSKYLFDDLNDGVAFDGAYDAPHHVVWSHNYKLNKLEFSLGWRFHSGIPYTVKTTALNKNNRLRIDFEDLNTARLPDYQRVDFSANYKFNINSKKGIKGKLGLTLQNITNKKNVLNRDYEIQTEVTSQGGTRFETPTLVQTERYSLGFVPNVVFRVSF